MKVTGLAIVPPPSAAALPKVTPELLASVLARYSRSNDGLAAILEKGKPERGPEMSEAEFERELSERRGRAF